MKRFSTIIYVLILLSIFSILHADSYYSAFGLGVPQYLVSSQSAGMGGAGIGVQRHLSYNSLNPAAVYLNGLTNISASFQGELAENTVADESVNSRQGNAAGFQFGVPMFKDRVALLASVKPLVKSQLTVDFTDVTDDYTMQRTIKTSGGLTSASLGFNYMVLPKLTLGAMFDFNFGAYNEVWKTEFDDDTYLNASDDIASHVWGTSAELGLHFRPMQILSFGAMLKTSSTLTIETIKTTGGGLELDPIDQSAIYPTSFGLGLALNLNKFLVAADFYSQLWENYEVDGQKDESMTNYMRVGGGIQYLANEEAIAKYLQRIPLRIGASYAQLPFLDINGDPVTESYVTFGTGFPFNKNAGRIDLAIEYGQRKSTEAYQYSERLVRISASVTMSEKWFQSIY